MAYTRPSRANTLDRIDDRKLADELLIRRLRCEVPGCTLMAKGMFKSGVPAWACDPHLELWKLFRKQIEGAVVSYVKGHMAQAAVLAYENGDDEVVISFEVASDRIMTDAERILAGVRRFATAPAARPPQRTLTADIPVTHTRPPIGTLPAQNASGLLFDPFNL